MISGIRAIAIVSLFLAWIPSPAGSQTGTGPLSFEPLSLTGAAQAAEPAFLWQMSNTSPFMAWQPGVRSTDTATATLSLPSVSVLPGELVTVPLTLALPEGQLYGVDLALAFNSSVVTATAVVQGALTAGWSTAINLDTAGQIRVAAAGAAPIETGGQLFLFVFQGTGSAGQETDLALTRTDLNEGEIPSELENGRIRLATPASADFTATPASGYAPLTVSLTNASTGEFDACAWDFGDGQNSANCSEPDHTYTAGGVYTVSLTVSGSGGTDTETKVGYITANLLQIAGAVIYWNDSAAIPGVLMTLVNGSVYTGVTGLDGDYAVTGILRGSYTLTPSLSTNARGISAYDASLVLQHAAGLITLSGYPAQAADVSHNGTISSYDASFILRKSVGLIGLPFPGSDQVWEFNPTGRSFPGLENNQTDQDFTGVLLGDVSGNWPTALERSISETANVALSLQGGRIDPNGIAAVQVVLDNQDATSIYSLDLAIGLGNAGITATEIQSGPLAHDMIVASNQDEPAVLRLGLAGARPIRESGVLLTIIFRVTGSQNAELKWSSGAINESTGFAIMQDGQLSPSWYSIYLPVVMQTP